jgi:hypothetical protein
MISQIRPTEIRRFNDEGVTEFRRRVSDAKLNGTVIDVDGLLTSDQFTEVLVARPVLHELEKFGRYDFCEHIHGVFDQCRSELEGRRIQVLNDAGLWTWLAARWSSQLTPTKNKKPFIGESPRWVFESQSAQRDYRHMLASPYRIFIQSGAARRGLNLILTGFVWEWNRFFEQVASRKNLYTNSEILRALDILYWDESKRKRKVGVTVAVVKRFGFVLNQLELTWDFGGMTSEEIITLLPKEFDNWK